jgi:hypothetical protein
MYGYGARDVRAMQEVLQHVHSISSLKRLSLYPDDISSPELLVAAGELTQLTLLCLRSNEEVDAGARAAGQELAEQQQQQQQPAAAGGVELDQQQQVPAVGLAAGGAVQPAQQAPPLQGAAGGLFLPLQHLVGLRQLQLSAPHLINHPTGWLSALTQLTLLAVEFMSEQVPEAEVQEAAAEQQPPAADVAQVSDESQLKQESGDESEQSVSEYEQSDSDEEQQELQPQDSMARCVAAVVPRVQHSRPTSLQQLVLFIEDVPAEEVVPSPLPGVSMHVHEFQWDLWLSACHNRRPMQPCPHLPGVWEVL